MTKKGSRHRGAIYLTFDDGPDPRFTPRILDLLDFFQVRATFFVLGRAAVRFPSLLQRICDNGHAVGNHTYNHHHPWLLSARRGRQEVRSAHEAITDICGESPRLFRPPYGRKRKSMLAESEFLGMRTVLWSCSALDWGMAASTRAIGRRLSRIEAGDIILCHDAPLVKNHPDMTLAVLPAFLQDCQARQLHFAGLDELPGDCPAARDSLSPTQTV